MMVAALACCAAFFGCGSQTTGSTGAIAAQEQGPTTQPKVSAVPDNDTVYAEGELIVGLAPDVEAGAASALGKVQGAIENLGFDASDILFQATEKFGAMLLVKTDNAHSKGDALARAAHDIALLPGIEFVQPNYRYISAGSSAAELVDDPFVSQGYQYYLDSTGAAEAWLKVDPATKVDVAVLDTGMYSMTEYIDSDTLAIDNPDNYHQEFDALNLDMEHAVDFVHSGKDELLPLVNKLNPSGDDNGHGTHVAAIIAANGYGIDSFPVGMAGVSPCARIVPIKVLDASGEGDTGDFIRAFEYLMQRAADGSIPNLRIVNMSVSLTFDDSEDDGDYEDADDGEPVIEADGEFEFADEVEGYDDEDELENLALRGAIQRAQDAGVITVCAAGNEGSSALTEPSDYPECVSVEALDQDGSMASYSNVNQHKDIAAPGTGVYSAWATQADSYAMQSGTSQATAIVSGILSMMWAANPSLTVGGAKAALYGSATTIAEQAADDGSHGALDATAAIDAATSGAYGEWDSTDDIAKWDADKQEEQGGSGSGSLESATITLAKTTYTYTGSARTPAVAVTLAGRELAKGVDYTVAYSANVKPGTAKVTVTGMGTYSGTASTTFKIKLGMTKIKKLSKGPQSFTVKWKRQKSGKVGYQIRYSPRKSMKGAKLKIVKKNATTKLKAKKLKGGKRYYVQVRTYKKIGGKRYWSAWSAKKSVKVR